MENGNEFRRWDELIPDALGLIFRNLSLQETLTVVPRVCKSWAKVVNGPYCWQDINLEEWIDTSESQPQSADVDLMLRMLITRSCGSLQKLTVCELNNDSFVFIAENARALKTLQLRKSNINDVIVEQVAPKFSSVTSLDLSYCCKIGGRALESVGKHCKSLTWLRRNMHPSNVCGKISQDDEAHAIAMSMPNLRKLEIAYLLIDTGGVLEILYHCPSLESLDLRGCWNVILDEKLVKEKFPRLNILGPHVRDHYEEDCEACSDYSESFYDSDSLDGMWDDGDESLELRFYEGFGGNAGYGWPQSP